MAAISLLGQATAANLPDNKDPCGNCVMNMAGEVMRFVSGGIRAASSRKIQCCSIGQNNADTILLLQSDKAVVFVEKRL